MDKKIDKIKEKIGVSKLDSKDREKLYTKFVDAGGKVLDEQNKNKNLTIDRERQRNLREKIEIKKEKNIKAPINKTPLKKTYKDKIDLQQNESAFIRFFHRMKIKLYLKFMGVIQFNGLYFDIKFLRKINTTYKPALMEIQMIFFDIFKSDPSTGRKVVETMNTLRPLYYEIIEMTGKIYDQVDLREIYDHYSSFPDVPQRISELKKPLMDLYKKLHVLKIYENTVLNSFEKALSYRISIDNTKKSTYSTEWKKLKNDLHDLFQKLYPRLLWLFCFYEGRIFESDDPVIESILSIKPEDKPGSKVFLKKKSDSEKSESEQDAIDNEKSQEENDDDSNSNIDDAVKRGLDILFKLDYRKLKQEYDASEEYRNISIKDKILLANLIFIEFDKEYSSILTTNKIKYKKDYDLKGLKDYKGLMQDFYDQIRKCQGAFKNYMEITMDYIKASEDKPVSNAQYLQYSKRITEIQSKRTHTAQNTRSFIRSFMEKLSIDLKELYDDIKNQRRFVDNPDDILEFSAEIEGNNKLNGKTISEAIFMVYCYCGAYAYRLGFNGDLSGNLEFKDEDIIDKPPVINIKNEPEKQPEKNSEGKSILDELEDIL